MAALEARGHRFSRSLPTKVGMRPGPRLGFSLGFYNMYWDMLWRLSHLYGRNLFRPARASALGKTCVQKTMCCRGVCG